MKKSDTGLSQESLKLIACITMLIDHIGAILCPGILGLRIIGRISFPIYCFLLAEGAHYTRSPKKYALRLLIGAALAELPFDLAFSGGLDFESCSVMVTLLLGYLSILAWKKFKGVVRIALIGLLCMLAEFLRTDYASTGIAIILLFALTRQLPNGKLWQLAGLTVLCWSGYSIALGAVRIPIQLFAVLAMVPICLYSGSKTTGSKGVQWAFYLFYPVHLALLWAVRVLR